MLQNKSVSEFSDFRAKFRPVGVLGLGVFVLRAAGFVRGAQGLGVSSLSFTPRSTHRPELHKL